MDKYKDIIISFQGSGFVYGDYDCYTNQKTYGYSLRASQAGATCYVVEKGEFMRFCKAFIVMGKAVS